MMNFVDPFLRWAGGKRWLTPQLVPIIRQRLKGCYYEPFLGSGAMYFATEPSKALLSDLNQDLINAFNIVKSQPLELLDAIKKLPVNEETYYNLRNSNPNNTFEMAVRFIYLNRTSYGGLYRENKLGKFNVPYGGGSRTTDPLWNRNLITASSNLLNSTETSIIVDDFETSLNFAQKGDVVFCDPTYRSATRNQFDRYGATVFDWADQERLAFSAQRAKRRGALVVICNTYCEEIASLYGNSYRILLIRAKSIGNAVKDLNKNREYLIILDPLSKKNDWRNIGEIERIHATK